MPTGHETIVFTRDPGAAAVCTGPCVLLAALDDPALHPATQITPTEPDLARAEAYGGQAQALFLARRGLLRHLLAQKLGCAAQAVTILADHSGAPRLASPSAVASQDLAPKEALFLSVSARGAVTALAFAPAPIGVDLEILGAPEDVPEAMLHEREIQQLEGLDPAARHKKFLATWTLKEAYLKALRTGLSREPAEIEVRCEAEDRIRLFDRGRRVETRACICQTETLGAATIIASCVIL